jgi:phosphoglucosamine mutase
MRDLRIIKRYCSINKMPQLFGTDGIRDRANEGFLSPEKVKTLSHVVGFLIKTSPGIFKNHIQKPFAVFQKHSRNIFGKDKVLIGMDTRASCMDIYEILREGFETFNISTIFAGIIPTPAIAYLTRKWNCVLGISISASHNPPEYNGIKFISPEGLKIPDSAEEKITQLFFAPDFKPSIKYHHRTCHHIDIPPPCQEYIEDMCNLFDKKILKGLSIVADCANGSASFYAEKIFTKLGARVNILNQSKNGSKINVNCGALHPDNLCKEVIDKKFNYGVAFDGDADRAIFIDETGLVRNGDHVIAACALALKKQKALLNNSVVTTIMSNYGLEQFLKNNSIKLYQTQVGDRYVVEEMLKIHSILGGEQSGHIIFLDSFSTGDGIFTGLRLFDSLRKLGKKFYEICSQIKEFPQVLENIPVKHKTPFHLLPKVQEAVDLAHKKLKNRGRLVLRYSGTEPVARVLVEGEDKNLVDEICRMISTAIKDSIGL